MGYHWRCLTYQSLTTEVFSNSRIGSNSTNKQEDKDEEDEAPLQPGQLFPFLQAHRREDREMENNANFMQFLENIYCFNCADFFLDQTHN